MLGSAVQALVSDESFFSRLREPPLAGVGAWRNIGAERRRVPEETQRMINKIVQSMADAMAGIKDGSTVLIGGFGAVGQPNALIDGLIEQGATDLTVACQQRRRRPYRTGAPDGTGARAQDHLLVPAFVRSGGVREPVSRRQDRAGDRAAGHARRTHACGRRRRAGVLHRDRCRHQDGDGQGDPRIRRPHLRDGARAGWRRGAGRGVGGRSLGQPDVQGVQAATSIR